MTQANLTKEVQINPRTGRCRVTNRVKSGCRKKRMVEEHDDLDGGYQVLFCVIVDLDVIDGKLRSATAV
jgi:hypothetical protein